MIITVCFLSTQGWHICLSQGPPPKNNPHLCSAPSRYACTCHHAQAEIFGPAAQLLEWLTWTWFNMLQTKVSWVGLNNTFMFWDNSAACSSTGRKTINCCNRYDLVEWWEEVALSHMGRERYLGTEISPANSTWARRVYHFSLICKTDTTRNSWEYPLTPCRSTQWQWSSELLCPNQWHGDQIFLSFSPFLTHPFLPKGDTVLMQFETL